MADKPRSTPFSLIEYRSVVRASRSCAPQPASSAGRPRASRAAGSCPELDRLASTSGAIYGRIAGPVIHIGYDRRAPTIASTAHAIIVTATVTKASVIRLSCQGWP